MVGKRVSQASEQDAAKYLEQDILRKETREVIERYMQLGHLPPHYSRNTINSVTVVEMYWYRYCECMQLPWEKSLREGKPADFIGFFHWRYKESQTKKSQSKTHDTYQKYWNFLSEFYSLVTCQPMDNYVIQQMTRFFEYEFHVGRNVSRKVRRRKEILDVEDFGLCLRYLWKHSTFIRCGNMMLQQSAIMVWSCFSGTRPAVLLPASPPSEEPGAKRRRYTSVLPKYVSVSDEPKSICYGDIELFYLKNRGSRDVLCAIINFRNLKGRPEGADGTRYFVHCDSQLAYCPILQIVTMAFRDKAFENKRLTPELIWTLKVPKRLPSLPLYWKDEKLRLPVLRRMTQTATGMEVDPMLPMTYSCSREAFVDIGKGVGLEHNLTHYHIRRWVANEVDKHYTEAERKRVLGQKGSRVFEQHYQSDCIGGLQQVALLRPPQDALNQQARKIRSRDPKAPNGLSDSQLKAISHDPQILELKQKRVRLGQEMRSLAGTISAAKLSHPTLFQEHQAAGKELAKTRKALRDEAEKRTRSEYFHVMPIIEVDKQIDRKIAGSSGHEWDSDDEDWQLPVPEYAFEERHRIVDAFYGPDAETLDDEAALTRRIQATKDLVALCKLSEPSRRGKRPASTAKGDSDDVPKQNAPESVADEMRCPTDICIVCERKFSRVDSLRRHLQTQHLNLIRKGSSLCCTRMTCKDNEPFVTANDFLWHAATTHGYDVTDGTRGLDHLCPKSPAEELAGYDDQYARPRQRRSHALNDALGFGRYPASFFDTSAA